MEPLQTQVPEKLIQQHTGHKNLKALRQCEHTSNCQLLDFSNIVLNHCENYVTSSVSVESTVSFSMPLSTVTKPSMCTTTFGPLLLISVSLSMDQSHVLLYSSVDAILLIVQSHFLEILLLVVKRSYGNVVMTKLFEGISVDELLDDYD